MTVYYYYVFLIKVLMKDTNVLPKVLIQIKLLIMTSLLSVCERVCVCDL